MKKLICIILGLFLFTCSYGQAIINRSGPANTVQDARWMSQYNAFLPRYNDTTAANLQKGIDSCGAIIFTYDIAALWFRSCSNGSKQWVQILPAGSPTPGGQAWVNPINVNLFTDASLNASFGTFGPNGIYFKTNNTTRWYLDRNGIAPETGTSVGIGIDPSDSNRITYFSGSGTTPTWQQTLTAGSTLNTDNTIDNGANTFTFTNNSLAGDYGFVISSNSTAATASGQVLTGILLSGANANSGQTTTSFIVSNTHTGTSSTNVGVNIVAQGANNNYALIIQPGGGNVGIGTTAPTQLLSLGTAGSTSGIFNIAGSTSGTITFQPQAAAGTYNWNWPTTAGTSGYLLTSAGGGSSAMTWTDPSTLGGALTSTYIGYGSGSNTLTGDANLTYTPASSAVVLDSGYLSFTGNKDFGSSVTGSIFKSSLYGLTFRGVPGASYDMLFFTQGGSTLFANPTGTTQMGTVGDWGFGLLGSTISAKVHITAGTASAGTAPLKFNAGTNLTSPEAGAMEWNGTNLFITQTTGPTRQTIAYASDLTFWNLNGTSTLTGGVTIDGSANDYDLKGNKSGINIANRITTIGDYLVGGVGTRIIVDESNDKLFMISAAISGATTGDALTVVDPSTGEIGVAPNLAFMLRKDSTDMYTSNGRIFVKDAAGNRTQISPHNDKGEWIYRSTDKDGVTTEINMIRLAELLEKVTGEKLIYKTKE